MLCSDESYAIQDVIAGRVPLQAAIQIDPATKLGFLSSLTDHCSPGIEEDLGGAAVRKIFGELRQSYDIVIIDLPPLVPALDTRATTELVDAYVLVVSWGKTHARLVERVVGSATQLHENLLGAVLSNVDIHRMKRYDRHLTQYYDHSPRTEG